TSPAFASMESIPDAYTCNGQGSSPPLHWEGGPPATAYVLFMIDLDAPGGGFVHWVDFGIPGSASGLVEGAGNGLRATQGKNDCGSDGYGGPCPPSGSPHRYVFTLYALNQAIDAQPAGGPQTGLLEGASATEVLDAMRAKVIAKGTLVGLYGRR